MARMSEQTVVYGPERTKTLDMYSTAFYDAHKDVYGVPSAEDYATNYTYDDDPQTSPLVDSAPGKEPVMDTKTLLDRLANIEAKVRRVNTPEGVARFHAPIGSIIGAHGEVIKPSVSRTRDSEPNPVAKAKVSKITLHKGKRGGIEVHQHTAKGTFVTTHPNMSSVDDHLDAILDKHGHVGSIHHVIGNTEYELHHNSDVSVDGKVVGKLKRGETASKGIERIHHELSDSKVPAKKAPVKKAPAKRTAGKPSAASLVGFNPKEVRLFDARTSYRGLRTWQVSYGTTHAGTVEAHPDRRGTALPFGAYALNEPATYHKTRNEAILALAQRHYAKHNKGGGSGKA